MLKSYEQGYSVMSKDLSGYSLESTDLEACKRHCQNGEVVVRRIPYTCGFSIRVMWDEFWKPFGFKYAPYNILWLHFSFRKEKLHKVGEVVYESEPSRV